MRFLAVSVCAGALAIAVLAGCNGTIGDVDYLDVQEERSSTASEVYGGAISDAILGWGLAVADPSDREEG